MATPVSLDTKDDWDVECLTVCLSTGLCPVSLPSGSLMHLVPESLRYGADRLDTDEYVAPWITFQFAE